MPSPARPDASSAQQEKTTEKMAAEERVDAETEGATVRSPPPYTGPEAAAMGSEAAAGSEATAGAATAGLADPAPDYQREDAAAHDEGTPGPREAPGVE